MKDLCVTAEEGVVRAAKAFVHSHEDGRDKAEHDLREAVDGLKKVETMSIKECLVGLGAIILGVCGISFLATRD
jgi:hypothetical protein